jgi:NAD kinase
MENLKIGIAAKLSSIEWDMYRLGQCWDQVIESYRQQGKDVDKILLSHERQKNSIEAIISRSPQAERVDIIKIQEGKIATPDIDLLITIGGDNFFQLCAHHFSSAYLVGVNSDPSTSHGALPQFDCSSLLPRLEGISQGEFSTDSWSRVATKLNGRRLEDTVCTVSLSIKATDMMSRYLLVTPGEKEEQKATGILIVSGAGSGKGSWYRNAGLYLPRINSGLYPTITEGFPKTSEHIKTLTREPFGGEDCSYRLLNHSISQGEEVSLVYWAKDPSELSLDSIVRYEIKEGDVLTFRKSENALKIVAKD